MKYGKMLWIVFGCALSLNLSAAEDDEKSYFDAVEVNVKESGKGVGKQDYALKPAEDKVVEAFVNAEPLTQVYTVFPASRMQVILKRNSIPERWLGMDVKARGTFKDVVQPGEYFVFQTGFFAMRQDCIDVKVRLSEFTNAKGNVIPMGNSTCFNTGGIDFTGKPFERQLDVPKGRLQALWLGIDIPKDATGTYTGKLWISPKNAKETVIDVTLEVKGGVLTDAGVSRDRALSRLSWLNSTLGIDDNVTRGFKPISFAVNKIDILGRRLTLAPGGLFASFQSFFIGANDRLADKGRDVLAKPMAFIVEYTDGTTETFKVRNGALVNDATPSRIEWESSAEGKRMSLAVEGWLEYDGYAEVRLNLTAAKAVRVKDVRLEVDFTPEMSRFMLGLNREGGDVPEDYQWKWDVNTRGQDGLWIGNVNGGIRCSFKGVESHQYLVNIYYPFGPLRTPQCWSNFGNGGIKVSKTNAGAKVSAYTGARTFLEGERETYIVNFALTPFKLLNKDVIYGDRILHGSLGAGQTRDALFKRMEEEQTNTAIFHHSNNEINPWINYPFRKDNIDLAKSWFDEAHKRGYRMKIYYTARELSMQCPEFSPFLSLNDEIIYAGAGKDARTVINKNGPRPWLRDNVQDNFIPAWNSVVKVGKHKGADDFSVIVGPSTRLENFYIAGLDYYIRKTDLDGLYIDDSSLDRITFRRARKLLDTLRGDSARIDIHSWNHFNGMAGRNTCLYMYMPVLPYVDLTWIGEGRNYNKSAEYLLIEATGIPFGVPGQWLQGGGHPWRGMLFNLTGRAGWHPKQPPRHVWKFWDDFGLKDCDMLGFWDAENPVTVNNTQIRATTYKGKGKAAIAVASWDNDNDLPVTLKINWAKLGLNPAKCTFAIPEIGGGFQSAQSFDPAKPLTIPKGQGLIISIVEK